MALPQVTDATPSEDIGDFESSVGKLHSQRILLDNQLEKLQASLQDRKADTDRELWLKLAQGFLAPTKTGSFGESAGAAAGNAQEVLAKQKADEKAALENQFKLAQLKYGMMKDDIGQQFTQNIGKPNATRQVQIPNNVQVPVAPQEGAQAPTFQTQAPEPTFKEEKYYDPSVDLKRALQSGTLSYKDYLELINKEKKEVGKMLTDDEAKANGLPIDKGQKWNKTSTGTFEIVSGTKPQEGFRIGELRFPEKDRIKYTEEYQGPEKGWVRTGSTPIDKPTVEIDDATMMPTAQMIADYKVAPPTISGRALSPAQYKLMTLVHSINPDYDALAYKARQGDVTALTAMKKDFAGTTPNSTGGQIQKFNAATNHLDLLNQVADGLANNNIQLLNSLKNEFKTAFGSADVTNFETVKPIVIREILKAVTANGGSVQEAAEMGRNLASKNSPDQLIGSITQYRDLMKGQLDSIHAKYVKNFNITDQSKDDFGTYLTGRSQKLTGYTAGEGKPNAITYPKPTQKDIDYAKTHPEVKDAFVAKFGVEPK